MNSFKCTNCGFTVQVEKQTPPEICPSCQSNCSFITDNCYIPDCEEEGK